MQDHATGVFEGGGIRGVALTGAAAAALDLGYRFDRVVGTSAGALVSSLVAAGYSSEELRQTVIDVKWPTIVGRRYSLTKNLSMILRLGFHSGNRLETILRRLLKVKRVITFSDLPLGALRVVATDLNHGRGVVLPDDLPRLGYDPLAFPVARAVLMSASVPFVFEPVRLIDRVSGEELLLADGAMAARFPVQLVPRGPSSIGFRLRLPSDLHPHRRIRGPVSLATAVIGAGITAREDLPPVCGPLDLVVEVEVDQDSLDFNISPRRAAELFDIGYEAAIDQLGSPPGTQPLPPASIPV
ncbi:MAG: patatin-like phospholipase family protein [Acidimicrobiia bacterium]